MRSLCVPAWCLAAGLAAGAQALAAPAAPEASPPRAVASAAAAAPHDPARLQAQLRQYLFDAARQGRSDMVGEFVAAGYDLNVRDEKGVHGAHSRRLPRPPRGGRAIAEGRCRSLRAGPARQHRP